MTYKVIILKSELDRDHLLWIEACQKDKRISTFTVVDMTQNDWLESIQALEFDLILCRPPGITSFFKTLYDERMMILKDICGFNIYPTLQEIYIYENKKLLKDWLVAQHIPHPKTFVSFFKSEAIAYASEIQNYPIVAKTNIGASGNGVVILKTKDEAKEYIDQAFGSGIKSKSGPKWLKGNPLKKIRKLLSSKAFLGQRLKEYAMSKSETQKNFVFFQEFIPHEFEWRCVIIGDSFFAHKKLALNNMSSGTLLKGYNDVPLKLLDFLRTFSCKTGVNSVAVDLFESEQGYLINEVQCFFGQSDPYQMLIEDQPGRYIYENEQWKFESGMFNTNQCYDLRLDHALSIFKK
jgi:glutathione synthase/RimK-type ligase-like ATP-grasp enzyme